MDLVLDRFDAAFLDSTWAYLRPLRLPVHALNHTLPTQYLKPTSTWVQAAAATAYATASSSPLAEEWTTVSAWPRDDWRRQYISLCAITMVGIHLMYFAIAGGSYRFLFDHRMMQHPRFLKGQIKMEIMSSLNAFPWLTLITVPWFVGEVRGYSKCYGSLAEGPFGDSWMGWAYLAFSCAFFLWFTDTTIYFIHRWEHHPAVYKHIHKPHHKWIIPTPFSSHAFHPLDGYVQSLPYHWFIYLFPLHKYAYLGLFAFVNVWTIAIHDSDMIVDHPLENIINGPAHHTLHHMYFTNNFGQFFTFCDKNFGTYRQPAKGDDPLLVVLAKQEKSAASAAQIERQEQEMAEALAKVEAGSSLLKKDL